MTQQELLATQNNIDEKNTNNNNSSNYTRQQLDGTPFWIIGNNEEGYKLTMGKYKISNTMATPEEVETWLLIHQWDVVLSVALCAYTDLENQKNTKSQKRSKPES